jgi:UDP-glucose 4-epimerase
LILITGGMGFIGLHTARRFLDAGENVVITQFQQRREPDFIKDEFGKRVFVERLDVSSAHAVLDVVQRHQVTGIVDLVAPALNALSPAEDYHVNMDGLINILEAGRLFGVKRVILGSSIGVYSGVPEGPYKEDMFLPIQSTNPTETWKKAWEITGLHYGDRTGLDVVSARLSGIYGPLYHTLANLPSRMCHAAAKGVAADFAGARGGVPFAEDESDFCYVKDCAQGIERLMGAEKLANRIYNVAAGVARSNQDVADAVRKVVPNAEIKLQPGRGPRYRPNQYLDITRAHNDVGYTPEYSVERAVEDYIGWLRNHPL